MTGKGKKKPATKKTTKKDKAVAAKTDVTTGDAHQTEGPTPAVEDAASLDAVPEPVPQAEPAPETLPEMAVPTPEPETPEPTPEQPSPEPPTVAPTSVRDPRLPDVGTVITRTFKGRVLQVKVLEVGFEYEGEIFPSISRLAKVITGHQAVNGFAFFKLGASAGGTGSARHVAKLASKITKIEKLVHKMRAALAEGALALADAESEVEEMKKKAAELQQGQ
jgi:hypothetical protein